MQGQTQRGRVDLDAPLHCERWTILGRGPSLLGCTPEHVLEGSHVIALNGAIYHHAIEADYWLAVDNPEAHLDDGGPMPPWGPNKKPEAVTCDRSGWNSMANKLGLVVRGFPGAGKDNAAICAKIGDARRRVCYGTWSVTLAIAWARYGGAKEIRILGADMSGTTRAYGKGNTIEAARRWRNEGKALERAREMAAARGIRVYRMFPDGRRA